MSSAASTSSDKGDWSAEHKPERIPRRKKSASSRWRSSAVVKKDPPCTHSVAQNRPLWRLLTVTKWRYALLMVQRRNDDDDCIGSTLGKLSRLLSSIREIFIETLNKNHWILRREKISWNFTLLLTYQKFYKAVNSRRGPCISSISYDAR